MGAVSVHAFDIDLSAIEVAYRNLGKLDWKSPSPVKFAEADVAADTVLTNPPFGTRKKGADGAFLEAIARIATTTV
jgi:predicted RNA methylase